MNHLLGRDQAGVLRGLASARTLLAFDFDGTLAPIVVDRDRARMRPRTAALLAEVAARYPTAVVSGRSSDDLVGRLGGAAVRWLVGNHGLEPGTPAELHRYQTAAGQARVLLEQALAGFDGVDVEDKRYSLAVHYRRAARPAAARAAIEAAVDGLPLAVRRVDGKAVVNVVPARGRHKGAAVARLRAATRSRHVLYVGDDVTDEDVFALRRPWLVGVRIGASARSAASWYLRDQAAIDELLAALVALRPAAARARSRG